MFAMIGIGLKRAWQGSCRAAAIGGAAAALSLFAAGAAQAGVAISVTPTFPSAVVVGGTYPAALDITWGNSGVGYQDHADQISGLQLTPACGLNSTSATCDAGFEEAGNPITLSTTGTASAGCKMSNDANTQVSSFTITPPATAGGAYTFSPNFQILPNTTCTINFTVSIVGMPTKDSVPQNFGGVQTSQHAGALATDVLANAQAGGTGSSLTSFPALSTSPVTNPTPAKLVDGGTLTTHDVGTIVGLYGTVNNRPTGNVTFKLYDTADTACTGNPVFTSGPFDIRTACTIGADNTVTCTSADTTLNKAGTWHWVASYVSGDTRNPNLAGVCSDEPVPVLKADPTVVTTPQPNAAVVGVDSLSDQAILSGGFNPTGTLTFTLWAPSSFNGTDCVGNPIFTSTVNVSGNNQYDSAVAGANLITQAGTYYWKAVYSGDSNNNAFTSKCTDEQVTVTQPGLNIVKTPDAPAANATITAGEDAVFTIVVSNTGAGVATNVQVTDALPAGFVWSFVSVDGAAPGANCTITNNVNLSCSFGNMNPGTSHTIVVKAPTTLAACTPAAGSQNAFVRISNPNAVATAGNAPTVQDPGSIDCNPPKIRISKTPDAPAANATIVAGDDAVFTIVVANDGPGVAKGVTVSDALPAGFTWSLVSVDSVAAPSAQCSVVANQLSCAFGNMNAGATHTIVVKAPTTYASCAAATPAGTNTFRINNLAATATGNNTTTVTDSGGIDCTTTTILIVKTPDAPSAAATISAGDDAVFTIKVSNTSATNTAKNLQLSDQLPAGFTWSLVAPLPAGATCGISAGGLLTCSFGDVAPQDSRTITVKAATTLAQCTPAAGQTSVRISNPVAQATATNAAMVQDAGSIDCSPPKIRVVKTPDAPSAAATISAGDDAVFTIVVANDGPGTARGVTLTDALPSAFSWSVVSVDGGAPGTTCTIAASTLNCSFGDMVANSSHTVLVKAPTTNALCTPPAGSGQAFVRLSNPNATADATNAPSANDSGSIDCNPPGLKIVKTPDAPSALAKIAAGDNAVFTIVVSNSGPGVAKGVTVSDALPAGFTWSLVSVDGVAAPSAACTVTANTLSCNFGNMNSGASHTIVVNAPTTVAQCTPQAGSPDAFVRISNPIAKASATNAPDVTDPGSIDCQPPTINVVKTPDGGNAAPGLITAGQDAVFTIVVSNAGPGVAKTVKLTDVLPSGLTWTITSTTATPPPLPPDTTCSIATGTLSCDFGNLNVGDARTVIIKATTVAQTCTTTAPAGQGNVTITNPAAKVTASNAISVQDDGKIVCQQSSPCDISIDKTCALTTYTPPKHRFQCSNSFDSYKMQWKPGTNPNSGYKAIDTNQSVDIRVWNGNIGSEGYVDIGNGLVRGPVVICGVDPDQYVQVAGLSAGKNGQAVDNHYWEVFPADSECQAKGWQPKYKRLGVSKFVLNGKNDYMKTYQHCDTYQGDGSKEAGGYVSDWKLKGMRGHQYDDDDENNLNCDDDDTPPSNDQQNCAVTSAGDTVTYKYTITNNSQQSVVVNLEDDKKSPPAIATNVTIPGKSSITAANPTANVKAFTWGPVVINNTIINTAKVTGNPGTAQSCTVTDSTIVTAPCFMGNPATRKLYPYYDYSHPRTSTSFSNTSVFGKIEPNIAAMNGTIRMWYTDDHALLLGAKSVAVRTKSGTTTKTGSVSPFVAQYPATGTKLAADMNHPLTGVTVAQGAVDDAGRPITPSLFCTDVTASPNAISGDWQMGGTGQAPHFVSGTWKAASVFVDQTRSPSSVTITPDSDPTKNGLVFGALADPVPTFTNHGFSTEVRWNVADLTCNGVPLQKGHTYRMQFIVHDGDAYKCGADVGQACTMVTLPPN